MNAALKQFKNTRPAPSDEVVEQRQKDAYGINFNYQDILPLPVAEAMRVMALDRGIPVEFIFFPLLTAAAGMFRSCAQIRALRTWTEPPILWSMILGRKGDKKSTALRLIEDALKSVDAHVQAEKRSNSQTVEDDKDQEETTPTFLANAQFTWPKLFDCMLANNGSLILLMDELAAFWEVLDAEAVNKKHMLSFHGGDSWTRSTKTAGTLSIERTHFNYTGFAQPDIGVTMLNQRDFEGFNDRHFAIICPQTPYTTFQNLGGSEEEELDLGNVLIRLRTAADKAHLLVTLSPEAMASFTRFYNKMLRLMKDLESSEDHRGVMAKAQGQCLRVAMVLQFVLWSMLQELNKKEEMEALGLAQEQEDATAPPLVISEQIMDKAIAIMFHAIKQKLALMPPCNAGSIHLSETDIAFTQQVDPLRHLIVHARYIQRICTTLGEGDYLPSLFAQKRLVPAPKGTKLNVRQHVLPFIQKLDEAGICKLGKNKIHVNAMHNIPPDTVTWLRRHTNLLDDQQPPGPDDEVVNNDDASLRSMQPMMAPSRIQSDHSDNSESGHQVISAVGGDHFHFSEDAHHVPTEDIFPTHIRFASQQPSEDCVVNKHIIFTDSDDQTQHRTVNNVNERQCTFNFPHTYTENEEEQVDDEQLTDNSECPIILGSPISSRVKSNRRFTKTNSQFKDFILH